MPQWVVLITYPGYARTIAGPFSAFTEARDFASWKEDNSRGAKTEIFYLSNPCPNVEK
jgi:hypothetical protein